MKLDFRAMKMPAGSNNRSEKHGPDDQEPAVDLHISMIYLNSEEVDDIVPGLADVAFDGENVAFGILKAFEVKGEMKGCTVIIREPGTDGSAPGTQLEIQGCTIKGVTLLPIHGGTTRFSGKVQFHPNPGDIDWIMARYRQEMEVAIDYDIIREDNSGQEDAFGQAA